MTSSLLLDVQRTAEVFALRIYPPRDLLARTEKCDKVVSLLFPKNHG